MKRFAAIDRLAEYQPETVEFAFKQEERGDTIELVVADAMTGIHVVKSYDDMADHLEVGLVEQEDGDYKVGQLFGQVKFLAYSADKEMLALYSEADSLGSIVILKKEYEICRVD